MTRDSLKLDDKLLLSRNTRHVLAYAFNPCDCCLAMERIHSDILCDLPTTLSRSIWSPCSTRRMREESWSSSVSIGRRNWLFEFMRIVSVSAKVVACMLGRSSVWCERIPYTERVDVHVVHRGEIIGWSYIAFDDFPSTSCNHSTSGSSSGFLRRRRLANNAQIERDFARIRFPSAQSARIRPMLAKLMSVRLSAPIRLA
jgi:hypothetical protein